MLTVHAPRHPCMLQGKLVSYSPQSGKYTVKYDDGQSEALLLEKERFVWHCPRALSAGYKPALHTLMQQLGADALKPLPQMGDDGKVVAVTPGPEVRLAGREESGDIDGSSKEWGSGWRPSHSSRL